MNNFNRLKKTLGRWFSFPWYPLLFAAYPVLALLAFNAGQIKVEAGWRPLLVCVGVAALLFSYTYPYFADRKVERFQLHTLAVIGLADACHSCGSVGGQKIAFVCSGVECDRAGAGGN